MVVLFRPLGSGAKTQNAQNALFYTILEQLRLVPFFLIFFSGRQVDRASTLMGNFTAGARGAAAHRQVASDTPSPGDDGARRHTCVKRLFHFFPLPCAFTKAHSFSVIKHSQPVQNYKSQWAEDAHRRTGASHGTRS